MKEIKSNPSKIKKCYITSNKNSILILTDKGFTQVKLTEIPIMDRYSNGSYLVKHRILDTTLITSLIEKENEIINDIPPKEEVPIIKQEKEEPPKKVETPSKPQEEHIIQEELNLEDIDKQIMTIDDLLKGFN